MRPQRLSPSKYAVLVALSTAMLAASGSVAAQETFPAERRAEMVRNIDALIDAGWQARGLKPAPRAGDEDFHRRVWLDLAGVIPRVSDVRQFAADPAPDKRLRLIDDLLESPAYSRHMANTWRRIMLPSGLGAEQLPNIVGLQNWLQEQFAANLRYDRLVADLLVASGGGPNGPALFYTAHQTEPSKLAAATSRIFLGIQLECAECHAHPMDRWTQEDFWGLAAFFAQVKQEGMMPGGTANLVDLSSGEVTLPNSQTVVKPRFPGTQRVADRDLGSRRMMLAIWMASRDNPYLPRATVNRVWSLLFGRGLVEPVDDLSGENQPSHPELLDALSGYFIETGFDMRELFRTIMRTRVYQLSSRRAAESDVPEEAFAVMAVRPLTAEQLYASIRRALLAPPVAPDTRLGGLIDGEQLEFVTQMQALDSGNTSGYQLGVPQALSMMNGGRLAAELNPETCRLLAALDAPGIDAAEQLNILFLATVSREPGYHEQEAILAQLEEAPDEAARKQLWADLLWGLLNSAEFALNR